MSNIASHFEKYFVKIFGKQGNNNNNNNNNNVI